MPRLGERLKNVVKKDFENTIKYYKEYKINEGIFSEKNIPLLKIAHKFASSVRMFILKLDVPEHSFYYLEQISSDSIQMYFNMFFGNLRAVRLHQRSLIENLLRYIYYYDHYIEHLILQKEPSEYILIRNLFEYMKKHPKFSDNLDICESIETLSSKYSEISKSVHVSTISDMEIINNLTSLNNPIKNINEEIKNLVIIIKNIIFILCFFHNDVFSSLTMDERPLISSYLTSKQIKILSGLQ
ncbi:MAG: hypothetical protein ACTSQY_09880 [Candidatus Odinarchaeia archaeon]